MLCMHRFCGILLLRLLLYKVNLRGNLRDRPRIQEATNRTPFYMRASCRTLKQMHLYALGQCCGIFSQGAQAAHVNKR